MVLLCLTAGDHRNNQVVSDPRPKTLTVSSRMAFLFPCHQDGTRHFESLRSWCQRSMNKRGCPAPWPPLECGNYALFSKKPVEYTPAIPELIRAIDHIWPRMFFDTAIMVQRWEDGGKKCISSIHRSPVSSRNDFTSSLWRCSETSQTTNCWKHIWTQNISTATATVFFFLCSDSHVEVNPRNQTIPEILCWKENNDRFSPANVMLDKNDGLLFAKTCPACHIMPPTLWSIFDRMDSSDRRIS